MTRIAAGATRAEIDKAEGRDFALGKGPLRPRDAATLILIDRNGPSPRVLLGRRHMKHAFMPGKFVFPGGRTDPDDGRLGGRCPLDPAVESKLMAATGARFGAYRARAIAMSAVRETWEEAGLLIGERGEIPAHGWWTAFAGAGVRPSLFGLRLIARATTPPGRVRRFDTRFFAAFSDSVALELPDGGPSHELEELVWLTFAEARAIDIPAITHTVLEELESRLAVDPDLEPSVAVPYYRMRNGRFARDLL